MTHTSTSTPARDEFSALEPLPHAAVDIGDSTTGTAQRITVRPLKIAQIPAFARALRPLSTEIDALISGGLSVVGVLTLLELHTDKVIEALAAATGATAAALNDSTLEQIGELLLAVIAANKDFLRGRLTSALQTAAVLSPGAGPTPLQP